MITRIEASHYLCFQSVSQELGSFHVLVGPNGSGKSVFLDILAFLSTFFSEGVEAAVSERTDNFHDLVRGREGNHFELAIEARKPFEISRSTAQVQSIRYELGVRLDPATDTLIAKDSATLCHTSIGPTVVNMPRRFMNGIDEAALLPGDVQALSWLQSLLKSATEVVSLDGKSLRRPSAPGQGQQRIIDGSNLARLVFQLQSESPDRFSLWVTHVQTALPDLASIRTILRPEDKHRYLMLRFTNGIEAPSWVISDGTLRLLALTILAYLPEFKGVYLVEEPENGVHPTAIETIYQSLSSVYDGQVLVTSHSPILLNMTSPEQLLCFSKTDAGPEIVRGDKHPMLQDWKREVSLSDLFAAGVLG